MLENARVKIPEATLVQADLLTAWPDAIDGPFDRVVSAYVLHEFDLETKVSILVKAAQGLGPCGRIIIGDVAFANQTEHDDAQQRWRDRWDHTEHYWVADKSIEAAGGVGLHGRWIGISICAGIFVFEPEARLE